jgi:hypothetical protein
MVSIVKSALAGAALVPMLLGTGICSKSASHPAPPKTSVVATAPSPTAPATSGTPEPTSGTAQGSTTPAAPPDSVFIRTVPYTPQAPFNNWDSAHEEYCEAAAVLMVGTYMKGDRRERIPAAEADQRMAQIVSWERQTYPGLVDLSLDKVGKVGSNFYGVTPKLQPATLEAVRAEVAAGRPVIIPVMTHGAPGGQKLAPNYGAVSVYHVIVIIGYKGGQVITNDPGFVQGENWPYVWSILETAMDAQTPRMGQGRLMLSFSA